MLSGGLMRPCAPADAVNKNAAHRDIMTVNNFLKILFIICVSVVS
jgi:hypothetical protein